jgi:hypothetical protein
MTALFLKYDLFMDAKSVKDSDKNSILIPLIVGFYYTITRYLDM